MGTSTRATKTAALVGTTLLALGTSLGGAGAAGAPRSSYTYDIGAPIALTQNVFEAAPFDLDVDPTTHEVYAANYNVPSIDVVDGRTKRLVRSIRLPYPQLPLGIALDPGTRTGYVVEYLNTVKLLDLDSSSITGEAGIYHPSGRAAVDEETHTAYVGVKARDLPPGEEDPPPPPSSASVVGVGPANNVAVDSSTHTVLTTDRDVPALRVIDRTNHTDTSVPVGNQPLGIAVDETTHTIYVANSEDGTVSVVDEASRTVTRTIRTCDYPLAADADSGTHTVYVTCADREDYYGDGTVAVIDGKTRKVTDSLPVGSSPIAVAVDPSTHVAWVDNFNDGTVQPITQTPEVTQTPPTVTSVRPAAGPAAGGSKVTIRGHDLLGTTDVRFGSTSAVFTVVSDTRIIATSPAHAAGTVPVRVRNPAGASPKADAPRFTYR